MRPQPLGGPLPVAELPSELNRQDRRPYKVIHSEGV
jgi:hypothetical protein